MQTILVVDGDKDFVNVLSRELNPSGYRVVTTPNSMEALKALDGLEKLDCLVLDVEMPKGMPHGLAIAAMARQRYLNLPVLFATARADLVTEIEEMPAKCFVKPVDIATLIAEIERQLASSQIGQPQHPVA